MRSRTLGPTTKIVAIATCLLLGAPRTMHGQSAACGATLNAKSEPARPKPGTLFVVRVTGATAESKLTGSVASEPLHFARQSNGSYTSFAPAPIDSTSLTVRVYCDAFPDTIALALTLATATYPLERLRVAPQFSATPDSALLARQQREAALAAEVSKNAHDTPSLITQPFAAPRLSRITSRYGGGRQFNGTVTSRHMGTDYAGATGSPIRAANRGVVRLVDRFFLGGNVVYVDHGAGLVTAYLHMSKQRVAVGDTVRRGQIVGLVGATGRVTGAHLHFITRYGAVSVDPESVLRLNNN